MMLSSFALSIPVWFLIVTRKIDLIYVRDSFFCTGLLSHKVVAKRTIVKISALAEDEPKTTNLTKKVTKFFTPLLDRLILTCSKRVAVNSEHFYAELVKRRQVKHEKEPLILSAGVDFKLIKKLNTNPAKADNKPITVGFIGLLSWWQGAEILAEAVSIANMQLSNLHLVFIGDGESRSSLEHLCKFLNLSYEITGFLSHEEALMRLKTLDVMVLPRKRTPTTESIIPLKVIEAWALGIPVVVTKHKIFLEKGYKDQEDVLFCEPQPESVKNAILALLCSEELRAKLSKNGPKCAKSFDYEKIVKYFLEENSEYIVRNDIKL
jgi:glycosyltransferase involved in cell wall biosynthesis